MNNEVTVTVVILATDENEALVKTIKHIREECSCKPEQIIVVLSQSATEKCKSAAENMRIAYGDYVKVTIQDGRGLGNAIRFGIEQVETSHMIFFGADLAISLESIDEMIAAAKREPEIIHKTSRWLEKNSYVGYNPVRLVLNRVAQTFLRILFNSKIRDLTNPVQIVPMHIQKSISWQEDGFAALLEQVIIPVRLGYQFKEIPVKCYSRTEGESKNSAWKTAMYFQTALRVRFTSRKKLLKEKRL